MFSSSVLNYKRLNMNLWPPSKGPVVTLIVLLILEIISRTLLEVPSVAPLFLAIAYAAFVGGAQSGLISAGITVAYALYSFSVPGEFLIYHKTELARVVVIMGCAPALALLVGLLKRRAEQSQMQALRMQNDQMLLLQNVSDAIIATDPEFRIQTWNRASEVIYGWSAAEARGKPIHEIIPTLRYMGGMHPDEVLALLKRRSYWSGQVIQAHRCGRELLIESSVRLIHDANGSMVGVVAVNRDVTEFRQAQSEREHLREQLEALSVQLEAVLQQMPAGIAIAEAPSGKLLMSNEQMAHILRHPASAPGSIVEYDQYQGFYADGRPYQPQDWPLARTIRTGAVVTDEEIDILRGDGTYGTISVSAAPIYDRQGKIAAGVVTFYDLTERKRIEQGQKFLVQASNILTDSLDYSSTLNTVVRLAIPYLADWCVMHLVNDDGTLLRPSAAHANSALDERIRELQRRHPIELDSDGPIARALRSGEAQLVEEMDDASVRAASYDEYHYQTLRELGFKAYMVVPIVARGRTLGAATFVSGRRPYTAADLDQAKELMRRCALAVDNARLYHDAQAALQTRDQLILTVSHDLKNPLSAIKGYANFLRRRVQRLDMPEAEWLEDSLEKIDTTTKKMTALLNELLDFARLQTGQSLDLDLRPTDLVALVSQTAAEYQRSTEDHLITVSAFAPELMGQYDTARLERVLENLLSNAIKYSPEGGSIRIEIDQADEARERWAVIDVRDEGLGIPAADLPHIFEPFRRAANVAGRVHGTGIGLTSAQQIVEQHGGTLTATSIEGAGSTFTIRLPVIS